MEEFRPHGRLPASCRVRKRSEFLAVQANARRVTTPHFVILLKARAVKAADKDASSEPRIGITASRRIGSAATRNRAKRLIREAFRATRSLWGRNIDVVVVVRRMDPGMKLNDVIEEWLGARSAIERQLACARSASTDRRGESNRRGEGIRRGARPSSR